MVRYNEDVIQNVIESNDIVDVIGQYVTLKRSGRSFMGRCPFHNEKTPSFSVSPEKQLYHCFGCGAGGNVVGFVMEIENMSFLEALEYLADKANITLPRQENPEQDREFQHKERLYELHRQIANHYFSNLKKNINAQKYLASRGFVAKTIKQFGIGYSQSGWQDAVNFLTNNKFTEEEMLDSGIVLRGKNNRLYDRFRNRVMIPILNIRGKIIGFGGRQFDPNDENGPKYLNSPETPVFSKSYELYNLNQAKKHIINNQLIIVEGYMDVIALCQYGILNVVAALGTAFTPYHAKALSRYANEIVLCFDGDTAGESATIKALKILRQSPLNIRIVRLDHTDDPDSYIRENGVDSFLARLREADTVVDFELFLFAKRNDVINSDGKIKYLNEAIPLLAQLKNMVEIELYAKKVALVANVSESMIMQEVKKNQQSAQPIPIKLPSEKVMDNIPKAYADAQTYVLTQLFMNMNPAFFDQMESKFFSKGFFRHLYNVLKKNKTTNDTSLSLPMITEQLNNDEERRQFSELSFAVSADNEKHFEESLEVIRYYYYRNQMQLLKDKIALLDEDNPEMMILIQELTKVKTELTKIQEVENGREKK